MAEKIMRTKCYCIYCPRHPKHEQRNQLGRPVTSFDPGDFIMPEFDHQSADVDCLKPVSMAFDYHSLDVEDFNYPVTAYGDGASTTGFYNNHSLTLYATCGNEQYRN